MTKLAQKFANAKKEGWAEWIRSEADEQALLEDCTFDLAAARRVRNFFSRFSEQLAHGGNPVLRWMANNVSLETDSADNWKPSKKRSRERIDGIVGLIMGLGMAQNNPDTEETPWGFYV